jgi:hypothetical protein
MRCERSDSRKNERRRIRRVAARLGTQFDPVVDIRPTSVSGRVLCTAGGPHVSGEDDFGVPHVSRLHVGLRLTGAGRDFR